MSYDAKFYKSIDDGSISSAERIIPVLLKLFRPKSVIDVGCGMGSWLNVAKKNGIKKVVGIDGDYIDKSLLHINENEFIVKDLRKEIVINESFDLALCLEVGEHIPKKDAHILVKSLSNLSSIILFSAALPGQGGNNHINEQWPEFWESLFLKFNFLKIDIIRKEIYKDDKIEWWYRQNVVLFVKKDLVKKFNLENNEMCSDMLFIHKSLLKKNYGIKNVIKTTTKKLLPKFDF